MLQAFEMEMRTTLANSARRAASKKTPERRGNGSSHSAIRLPPQHHRLCTCEEAGPRRVATKPRGSGDPYRAVPRAQRSYPRDHDTCSAAVRYRPTASGNNAKEHRARASGAKKDCGRCKTTYCSVACQTQHWKEGGTRIYVSGSSGAAAPKAVSRRQEVRRGGAEATRRARRQRKARRATSAATKNPPRG